jgi:hypothetical protein
VAQANVFSKNGYCVPNKIPKFLKIFDKIEELLSSSILSNISRNFLEHNSHFLKKHQLSHGNTMPDQECLPSGYWWTVVVRKS